MYLYLNIIFLVYVNVNYHLTTDNKHNNIQKQNLAIQMKISHIYHIGY